MSSRPIYEDRLTELGATYIELVSRMSARGWISKTEAGARERISAMKALIDETDPNVGPAVVERIGSDIEDLLDLLRKAQ
jgi:hypothetical protein